MDKTQNNKSSTNKQVVTKKKTLSNAKTVSPNADIVLSQQQLLTYSLDPYSLQAQILNNIEQYTNNQNTVTSATTPFTLLLETMSMLGANALIESNSLMRQKYLSLANANEIVYFANEENYQYLSTEPANSLLTFRFNVNSMRNQEKATDDYWETILPKNTVISVLGKDFTLQNDYSIRSFEKDGNFQVLNLSYQDESTYVIEQGSTISSRTINDMTGDPYIEFEIPVKQLYYTTFNYTLLNSELFTEHIAYSNKFNSIKVYSILPGNQLFELPISFNNKYIDPTVLTVYVNVQEDILTINIPACYLSLPNYPEKLFIELYTTDGSMYLPLNTMSPSDYSISYDNIGQISTNIHNVIVYCFSTQVVYQEEKLVTFEDLKNNLKTSYNSIPITNPEIITYIKTNGFDLLEKSNNDYLVYKQLPYSISEHVFSNPISYTNVVPITLGDYVKSTNGDISIKSDYPNIKYFGNGYFLIKSGNVFKDNNGICEILGTSDINNLIPTSINYLQIQQELLNNKYFINNYYYYCNFDMIDKLLVYNLDYPELYNLRIKDINNSLFISNIQTYNISKSNTKDAYEIIFSIIRADGDLSANDISTKFNNIVIQIRIPTLIDGQYVYFNSTPYTISTNNDLPAFKIEIPIDYNLNLNHIGITTKGDNQITPYQLNEQSQEVFIKLQGTIDIYTMIPSTYNDSIDPFMQDEINHRDFTTGGYINYKVFAKESLNYNLGQEVTGLYNIFNSTTNANEYGKYTTSVPLVTTTDFYDNSSISYSDNKLTITPSIPKGTQLEYINTIIFKSNDGILYANVNNDNETGTLVTSTTTNDGTTQTNLNFLFENVSYTVNLKTPNEVENTLISLSQKNGYTCILDKSEGTLTLTRAMPSYQYQVNDPVLSNLEPTIDQVNGVTRYIPIQMLEYEYDKHIASSIYYKSNNDFVNKVLNQYILYDLQDMNKEILFGNTLKYYSRHSNKDVIFNNNISSNYVVTPNVTIYYKLEKDFNPILIKSTIGNILQNHLCQDVINVENLETIIATTLSDPDLINVRIDNLLPDNHKYLQYTSLNRLALRKKLTLDVTGDFLIEYDINLKLLTI